MLQIKKKAINKNLFIYENVTSVNILQAVSTEFEMFDRYSFFILSISFLFENEFEIKQLVK